jgi:hypothetical protein
MNRSPETPISPVSPHEVARRVAEYRRMGFETRAKPHIIYRQQWDLCPWPGCEFRIAGIDFQLETGDPANYASQLAAWWLGAGLVGRCPGCNQYVLFGFHDKQCVEDLTIGGLVVLPDDWYQRAYVP